MYNYDYIPNMNRYKSVKKKIKSNKILSKVRLEIFLTFLLNDVAEQS